MSVSVYTKITDFLDLQKISITWDYPFIGMENTACASILYLKIFSGASGCFVRSEYSHAFLILVGRLNLFAVVFFQNASTTLYCVKQSIEARNRVGIGLSYRPARLHSLVELVPWNRFFGSLEV
jgi:hypothetical protein